MNESSDEPPLLDRYRSWARSKAHASNFNPFGADDDDNRPALPLTNQPIHNPSQHGVQQTRSTTTTTDQATNRKKKIENEDVADKRSPAAPPPAPPPVDENGNGEKTSTIESEPKPNVGTRFYLITKTIILSSWINWLLVFVPVGIALGALHKRLGDKSPVSPTIIFVMNAIAIIPLAGLLSFATESVADKLGDTVGALMNVTFGNAVELIILYGLLCKNLDSLR